MSTTTVQTSIDTLADNKKRWATLPIVDKIAYLDGIKARTVRLARQWVEASVEAKGLSMDDALAGEEWTGGPFSLLWQLRDLRTSMVRLSTGIPLLEGLERRTLPDGTVCVDVFPTNVEESLLFAGMTAEMWLAETVTLEDLDDSVGAFYRQDDPQGGVTVVLGAGNISSIAPLDVLHTMFNEGQVAVLKLNPVTDYLGPVFEGIFEELVRDGFVRFEYGGADTGEMLTTHPKIDRVHVTGSEATFYAIVYGAGEEGERRRQADEPRTSVPVSAELGGVTPFIVVPGRWSAADLRYQAEHIVSAKMHNSGFNCVGAQVLVLAEEWDQADELLEHVRAVLDALPDRPVYYPGAPERMERAANGTAGIERFGADGRRLLIDAVDAQSGSVWFSHELFGPGLAVTRLPGNDTATFLANATRFANQELAGTLGATVVVDPATQRRDALAVETAIANLDYGTVCVNVWSGAAYFMPKCAWGAAPGHPQHDIGSGRGTVHNTLMFDSPVKSIVRGPFAPSPRTFLKRDPHLAPKLIYMVTNKQAHIVGEKLIDYMDAPTKRKLASIALSAVRG